MLDRLLETGAHPKKSRWGGTVSVAVHGAIIALVVAANAKAGQPPARIVRDPVVFTLPTPHDDPPIAPTTGRGVRRGAATVPAIPTVDLPPLLNPSLPGTDFVPAVPGADPTLISAIAAGDGGAAFAVPTGSIAAEATVDTPVRALAERAPAYPETLRAAGVGGVVRVRFVVDTTGRAEPNSIRVVESSHELFTRAVLLVLRQARFAPGAVAGRPVRTLVERAYRFDIADAAR